MSLRRHLLHISVVFFAFLAVGFAFLAQSPTNGHLVVLIVTAVLALMAYVDIVHAQRQASSAEAGRDSKPAIDETSAHQNVLLGSGPEPEAHCERNDEPDSATQAIRQLAESLSAGDITARVADASGLNDDAATLLNDALTRLNYAIDEALALTDVAANGDLTGRTTGKYDGHTAALTTAINGLLDGLTEVVETLVHAVDQNESRSQKMGQVASDLTISSRSQIEAIEAIESDFERISSGLSEISQRAVTSKGTMNATVEATALGRDRMANAVKAMERVEAGSKEIGEFVELIKGIAKQSKLLSVNAMVEAARAGTAGRGFSCVATEVGELATRTREAVQEIADIAKRATSDVEAGSRLLHDAVETIDKIDENASNAFKTSDQILAATRTEVKRVSQSASLLLDARHGADANMRLAEHADKVSEELSISAENLRHLSRRFILSDDEMIRGVQKRALDSSAVLEAAVDNGEISLKDLFSRDYQPIPDSNPVQYMTPFVAITDKYVSPIIETSFDLGPGVIFGAIMNFDAFLSTHSRIFSKPQGPDPIWNAANSRNRTFFRDRVGLAGAKNSADHILQVYRRDMGGGRYKSMKDISAPVFVKGRHWGVFRIGYHTILGDSADLHRTAAVDEKNPGQSLPPLNSTKPDERVSPLREAV